jgi:hypothetical protein
MSLIPQKLSPRYHWLSRNRLLGVFPRCHWNRRNHLCSVIDSAEIISTGAFTYTREISICSVVDHLRTAGMVSVVSVTPRKWSPWCHWHRGNSLCIEYLAEYKAIFQFLKLRSIEVKMLLPVAPDRGWIHMRFGPAFLDYVLWKNLTVGRLRPNTMRSRRS